MSNKIANDLRKKDNAALAADLVELGRERFNLRIQRTMGKVENTARLRVIRRSAARIKTLLHEKRRGLVPLQTELTDVATDDKSTGSN